MGLAHRREGPGPTAPHSVELSAPRDESSTSSKLWGEKARPWDGRVAWLPKGQSLRPGLCPPVLWRSGPFHRALVLVQYVLAVVEKPFQPAGANYSFSSAGSACKWLAKQEVSERD